MRDGRLSGGELASYECHLAACSACQAEVQALRLLGERLRAERDAEPDELHERRERTRLLAAFDRALVTAEHPYVAWRRWALPLVITALAMALGVFWHVRSQVAAPSAATALVRPQGGALWSRRTEGSLERIALERGTLWIQVGPNAVPHRLLVLLPDGELQDIGTIFIVSVENGRTTHVAVQQGSVVLRLRGQPAIALGPGENWDSSATAAASISSAQPLASNAPLLPAASASALPVSAASASEVRIAADPARDFRTAMAALNAGDNARAASAFHEYLTRNPNDRHAEDAAYLRIIALQRAGDTARMNRAVYDYLARYPTGFRHAEVEKLRATPRSP